MTPDLYSTQRECLKHLHIAYCRIAVCIGSDAPDTWGQRITECVLKALEPLIESLGIHSYAMLSTGAQDAKALPNSQAQWRVAQRCWVVWQQQVAQQQVVQQQVVQQQVVQQQVVQQH